MKIFLDTADVEQIREARSLGLADGVTTNPTLILKSGRDFKANIQEIASIVEGPVLAEVVGTDLNSILREGREFAGWAPNVYVKIPVTPDGLKAVRILESENIRTAVTLIFSASQALLAAKAGASLICPFIGRLDDISSPGMELVEEILEIYDGYPELPTEVIVASVRNPNHVVESALLGAHGVTVPLNVIHQMMRHPLTDIGIERFLSDWKQMQNES